MHGCIAPSEVPGVSSQEASVFGGVAEDLIYADFVAHHTHGLDGLFRDDHNPAAYLYFLASRNPSFTQARQLDYFTRVGGEKLMGIPDFLLHRPAEKAFYEVKPDSASGRAAGTTKVGNLSAIYKFYGLPYTPGVRFHPRDHKAAVFGSAVTVTLKVRRAGPGLLVYKLCLDADHDLAPEVLAVLLALVVREMNKQKGTGRFRPVDLAPVFRSAPQLQDLARLLGLGLVAGLVANPAVRVGWRHFWKAVAVRFAARGALAATLAAADGPLPVGDLLAAGMTLWTVIDVIRLSDELWRDADGIARREA